MQAVPVHVPPQAVSSKFSQLPRSIVSIPFRHSWFLICDGVLGEKPSVGTQVRLIRSGRKASTSLVEKLISALNFNDLRAFLYARSEVLGASA